MKKIRILFIILSICVITLCGCKNLNTNTENKEDAKPERLSTKTTEKPKKETEISSFSTNILDQTPNRVYNISLTCSKINDVIVKNGETFSINTTVGIVDESTGYKTADVLDADGNPFKDYGGGNCQVSSTLYNAVLAVSGLEVVERHEHSKRVYYVEKDKDAAVDEKSNLDFKFKNNTGFDIKIKASSTNETVTIKLLKIENA